MIISPRFEEIGHIGGIVAKAQTVGTLSTDMFKNMTDDLSDGVRYHRSALVCVVLACMIRALLRLFAYVRFLNVRRKYQKHKQL